MYKQILSKIKETLKEVKSIKKVYGHPLDGGSKESPIALYVPTNLDNEYQDTSDYSKQFNFRIFIVANIAGSTVENVFENVLPNAVDEVIQKFDEKWDAGTIDGHRLYQIVSVTAWDYVITEKSKTAYVELLLKVKTITS